MQMRGAVAGGVMGLVVLFLLISGAGLAKAQPLDGIWEGIDSNGNFFSFEVRGGNGSGGDEYSNALSLPKGRGSVLGPWFQRVFLSDYRGCVYVVV